MSKQVRVPDELVPSLTDFLTDLKWAVLLDKRMSEENPDRPYNGVVMGRAVAAMQQLRQEFRQESVLRRAPQGAGFTPVVEVRNGLE